MRHMMMLTGHHLFVCIMCILIHIAHLLKEINFFLEIKSDNSFLQQGIFRFVGFRNQKSVRASSSIS